MNHIELIAVDLDGPLLTDSFAPLLKQSCDFYGLDYTRDMENNMLSRNRRDATAYFMASFGENLPDDIMGKSHEELTASYFEFRKNFLAENPISLSEGAADLLALLPDLGVRLICYGGLDEDYMRCELGAHADVFERYVSTNDFRPGVKEIVHDIAGVSADRALFIDDVNFVAEHAREQGCCFIGVPARNDWGWQRLEMQEAGVPFILDHAGIITRKLLDQIDEQAGRGSFWK
ncbi:MAG: hypothetical protein JJ897_17185 [Marinibacterium sp.]|nr:hypothetical protein [Marinibacterium sp.]